MIGIKKDLFQLQIFQIWKNVISYFSNLEYSQLKKKTFYIFQNLTA